MGCKSGPTWNICENVIIWSHRVCNMCCLERSGTKQSVCFHIRTTRKNGFRDIPETILAAHMRRTKACYGRYIRIDADGQEHLHDAAILLWMKNNTMKNEYIALSPDPPIRRTEASSCPPELGFCGTQPWRMGLLGVSECSEAWACYYKGQFRGAYFS